jgi:ankyrin repeat protein
MNTASINKHLLLSVLACMIGGNAALATDSGAPVSLHKAAWTGNIGAVERILGRRGTLVDKKDESGDTALHCAASRGHHEIVEKLLKAGAAINTASSTQWTALHKAARNGHVAVVTALLAHKTEEGRRIVDIHTKNERGATALHAAASAHSVEIVKALLDAGAHVNETTYLGGTALDCARKYYSPTLDPAAQAATVAELVKWGGVEYSYEEYRDEPRGAKGFRK